jgi:prepilin-type processing-associated H-X9-DG protein
MDHTLTFAQMPAAGYNTAALHRFSRGAIYNDANYPNTVLAAQAKIPTFVCPTTPIGIGERSPDNFGVWDYMFISVSDIEDGSPGATDPVGTRPTSSARRLAMTIAGFLSCEGRTLGQVTAADGTSNTILCIEDAGRAHPNAGLFASLSTRPSPNGEGPAWTGGTVGGRRMYAWADPDSVTNGLSGPSNATGSRVAAVNNYRIPLGGPPECPWRVNNCGPNDEPFSFHTGGVNCLWGDGSVRFIRDTVDALTLKWIAGFAEGRQFDSSLFE